MFFYIMKNKFISILFIFLFIVFYDNLVFANKIDYDKITSITICNKIFNNTDNNILISDENILISANDILKPLGIFVDTNYEIGEIYIAHKNKILTLFIDKDIIKVNNSLFFINTATKIINNKIMIPLQCLEENLDLDIKYNTKDITSNPPTIDDSNINQNNCKKSKIKKFIIPNKDEKYIFKIEVDGNIDKIEKNILNNEKLVIDIYNSDLNLDSTNYSIEDSFIKKVNFSKINISNIEVSRATFDLKKLINYSVNISLDKKYIEIKFEENNINNLTVINNNNIDYITVESSLEPYPNIYFKENNLLVIEMKNSILNKNFSKLINSNKYLSNIEFIQNNDNINIICNISVNKIELEHEINGNKLIVKLFPPTYKNIDYVKNNNTIILNKNLNNLVSVNSIITQDDYHNKKYILNLSKDFSPTYGYGNFNIYNDIFLNSINIKNVENKTILTLNEKKVFDINISEDNNNIYIKLVSPKEKYKKIILLDPGHGGKDRGTKNLLNQNIIEKNIALDISNKVAELLEKNEYIKVYTTRKDDTFVALKDRAELGNDISDLFVSIHLNASPTNSYASGVETYYCKNNKENNFNISRKNLAEIFQNNIVSNINIKNRGIKTAAFVVLKDTDIPSILIELGFLTNNEEANKFNNEDFRKEYAEVIYNSILKTFEIYKPNR